MKKIILVGMSSFVLGIGLASAAQVHDWKDLDKVHNKIVAAIADMDKARKANHYDMAGHGANAEKLLHDAEHELHEAVESAKAAH